MRHWRGAWRPLVQRPQPSGDSFFGLRRPQPEKPVFDFRARFCHSAPHGNARFRLQTPGQGPGGPTAISYQYEVEEEDTHFGSEPVAEGPGLVGKAFGAAAATSETLRAAPDNGTLLALYSLHKQGSIGDATGARPCMMDVLGRAKFDAWAARKGLAREQAMADYVKLVASVKAREAETV